MEEEVKVKNTHTKSQRKNSTYHPVGSPRKPVLAAKCTPTIEIPRKEKQLEHEKFNERLISCVKGKK